MAPISKESGFGRYIDVAEFLSDAQIVVQEMREVFDWLETLEDATRRRVLARYLVLNLTFLAEVVGELYTLVDKITLELKQKQRTGTVPADLQLPVLAREQRRKASTISRYLKPVRNYIAHPIGSESTTEFVAVAGVRTQ